MRKVRHEKDPHAKGLLRKGPKGERTIKKSTQTSNDRHEKELDTKRQMGKNNKEKDPDAKG